MRLFVKTALIVVCIALMIAVLTFTYVHWF